MLPPHKAISIFTSGQVTSGWSFSRIQQILRQYVPLSLVAPPLKWLIPADATPLVLGRNGGGIREVNTASGANVIVAQQTLGGPGASPHVQGTRVVSASGTIDAVVAAARIVLERIYGA